MNLLELLSGKKTYLAVIVGLLYVFGGDQGWWKVRPEIVQAIGLAAVAFLRSGVNSAAPAQPEKKDDPNQTKLNLAVWLLLPFLAFTFAAAPVGCSSPEKAAYRAAGVTTTTVDAAMQAWGQYVRDGKATVAQRLAVRDAYGKYQLATAAAEKAALTAKAGGTNTVSVAIASAAAASSDVIALVNSIVK